MIFFMVVLPLFMPVEIDSQNKVERGIFNHYCWGKRENRGGQGEGKGVREKRGGEGGGVRKQGGG